MEISVCACYICLSCAVESVGSDSALGKFSDSTVSWIYHSYLILSFRKIKPSCWACGTMVKRRASFPLWHPWRVSITSWLLAFSLGSKLCTIAVKMWAVFFHFSKSICACCTLNCPVLLTLQKQHLKDCLYNFLLAGPQQCCPHLTAGMWWHIRWALRLYWLWDLASASSTPDDVDLSNFEYDKCGTHWTYFATDIC